MMPFMLQNRRCLIAALLVLLPASHLALAQETSVVLRKTALPVQSLLPTPDLDGIRPGSSPDEVTRAINALGPAMQVERQMGHLSITVNGRDMASTAYISLIKADNFQAEPEPKVFTSVSVAFGLPTTGGGAVAAIVTQSSQRGVTTGAAFAERVVKAYGPPSWNGSVSFVNTDQPDAEQRRGVVAMQWLFNGTSRLPHAITAGSIDASEIELGKLSHYANAVAGGEAFGIEATGNPLKPDRTRLFEASIGFEDIATKDLSLREAVRQLTEAAGANK